MPEGLPPLGRRSFFVFNIFWFAAFLLALIGPAAGIYERFAAGAPNSALLPGSRAGFAVAEEDVTRIRFPVGPEAAALGIRAGDDIIAVNTLSVSEVVDFSPRAIAEGRVPETDVAAFYGLLQSSETSDQLIRLRGADGREREVIVTTGEHHIEQAAAAYGIPSWALQIIDLLHVLTYPFLLAAAWILNRRNARDSVSSILSLAILLTVAAEQPSATFLDVTLAWPLWAHTLIYDLGNILLLAGILLFPHGRFSPRHVLMLLPALPMLMLLEGDVYRLVFIGFMLSGVMVLVRRLQDMPVSAQRQQIKWALFGFSGYALFLAASLIADMLKTEVGSLWMQMALEGLAGLSLGLAFLALQAGLLVALLCYRLYDAEVVISRSASFAIVTIFLAAVFAGVMEGIIEGMQEAFGDAVGTGAAVMGAAMATVLINPLHERVQQWAERRFQKNLIQLRDGLPQAVRDLREVATLSEFLQEVLSRVHGGVRTVRSAFVLDGMVAETAGIGREEVRQWLADFQPTPEDEAVECDPHDSLFPVRIPLRCANARLRLGWLLIGPRPDGSISGNEERETLGELAAPIANATRIVLKREEQERSIAEALAEHRRRIADLESRLAAGDPASTSRPAAIG